MMSKLKEFFTQKDFSLTFGADRQTVAVALMYVLFLCVFEFFYFRASFAELTNFLGQSDNLIFSVICFFYLAASLYLLFLFILLTISAKWYIKIPLIAIFSLALFAQFGYQNALGRFLIPQDFISAFSATNEQKLDSIYEYASFSGLLPGGVLTVFSFFKTNSPNGFGGRFFGIVSFFHILFYLHLSFINPLFFDQKFSSNSFGNFCLTTADYLLFNPVLDFAPKKRELVESAVAADFRPANNIIFIFDESVRGDHLSLNGYSRPTTPYLDELAKKKLLTNWGIAVSASTLSHTSYDAMISGATPEKIDDVRFHNINTMPNIFQYAKAMNYKTHLIDGQMKNYWGGIADDLNFIDNFVSLAEIDNPDRIEDWQIGDRITNEDNERNQLKQWQIDTKIAKLVNEIFSSSKGNFIFVYKRGCHFPYEKNYPPEETVWKPVYKFKEQYEVPPADKIDAVKNSYDNALRYNLDNFFRNLASDYQNLPNNSVIIYTSDHGESFYANGKAGHGGDSREEAMVPLFILGAPISDFDPNFKASHSNIFTTLLDFMNFPGAMRKHPYSISLLKAKKENSGSRFYNPPKGKRMLFD